MVEPNPPTSTPVKRFRTNPVELAIFCVVTLFFVNSVYHLFYDHQTLQLNALSTMAASPVSEDRSPASAGGATGVSAFFNLEVKCDPTNHQEQETSASKVRITGALCGLGQSADTSKLQKTIIINGANKFTATVFTDQNAGKYSTDYIPLNTGKNPIHIEFSYRDGKIVSQDVSVNRNQ